MTAHSAQSAYLEALTSKLVADIRRRGLSPGERYLTTEQASRMLGVRKAVANKAMHQLAKRKILIRRQRSGTFVGPRIVKPARSKVQTVHVLLPKTDLTCTKWSMSRFVQGIHHGLADVNVQFSFIPAHDSVAYVRELIDGAQKAGQLAGVVPVSCLPEVYRYLADIGIPAVAYGSFYSMQPSLTSVDTDNRESGRLMMQYLIDRGHRRAAFMMPETRRRGDNDFYDGISEVAAAASLPHTALIQRLVPGDVEAVRSMTMEMLTMDDRPTAVIARGGVYADVIRATADSLSLGVPGDLEIVFDSEGQIEETFDQSLFPRVQPQLSFTQIAAVIGNKLKEVSEGASAEPERIVIPVEFCRPRTVGGVVEERCERREPLNPDDSEGQK